MASIIYLNVSLLHGRQIDCRLLTGSRDHAGATGNWLPVAEGQEVLSNLIVKSGSRRPPVPKARAVMRLGVF
jgi:hypothetical protein